MNIRWIGFISAAVILAGFAGGAGAATLTVGPGGQYARIEQANAAAQPGDLILVSPLENGEPYRGVAVLVTKPRLTFRAAGDARVKISGEGFDYSGRGSIPRAIFQFNPDAESGMLDGFDLSGASNQSHNAAGVRINQADHVTIRNCDIHHNNMGVMSNGGSRRGSAANQIVENCAIHHNGDLRNPGYSHNLYLGGAGATVRFCDVYASTSGHNLKSRARFNRIEYSYIHDSANRELDIVEAEETVDPGSHAVVIGCIIAKAPRCPGNRGVIHFGQDGGGERDGTLHLVYNTIVTPFISPVVTLSSPRASASVIGNVIHDGGAGQNRAALAEAEDLQRITGGRNWMSAGFGSMLAATAIEMRSTHVALGPVPLFADPAKHDYRLAGRIEMLVDSGVVLPKNFLPTMPDAPEDDPPLSWQYKHPHGGERRVIQGLPDLGALEFAGE